jgi:hypothetical protein
MADNTDYSIPENLPLLSQALNERSDAEKTSNVTENITGNFEVGPNPGFKNNPGGMARAIVDYQDSAGTWAQDENKFAKTFDYGADWKHADFNRYYSKSEFKNLGFNPTRNNDVIYNEKTSASSDFARAFEGSLKLAGHGFIATYEGSESSSEAMERINKEYGSTRGGFGGFISNAYLSAGYTQGLVTNYVAETMLLAAAGAVTAETGVGPVVAVAGIAAETGKLFKGLKSIYTGLKASVQTFKTLENINLSRKLYAGIKATPMALAKFAAPNTLNLIKTFRQGANAADGFYEAKNYMKVFKTFGAMYGDYKEARLAASEGLMEGKMLQHKMNDSMINEFYQKNGYMPYGADAEDIYERSVGGGTMNSIWNTALIYATNKIVLGNFFKFGKSVGSRAFALRGFIDSPLGTLKKTGAKIGEDFYKLANPRGLASIGKSIFTSEFSPISSKYMLANAMEGFQEVAQDAFSNGFEKYYKNKYTDPQNANFVGMLDALAEGSGKQFSGQGFETFASGYVMNMFVSPLFGGLKHGGYYGNKILANASPKYKEKYNVKTIAEDKALKKEGKEQMLNSINQLINNHEKLNMSGIDYMTTVSVNHKTIELMSDVLDKLEKTQDVTRIPAVKETLKSLHNEIAQNHFYNAYRTGNLGSVRDFFNGISKLSDQELADYHNQPVANIKDIRDKVKKGLANIDTFEKIAKKTDELYPTPTIGNKTKETDIPILNARINAINHVKKLVIFANTEYIDAADSMADSLENLGKNLPLSKTNPFDITMLYEGSTTNAGTALKNKIDTLTKEIQVLSTGTREQRLQSAQKTKTKNILESFTQNIKHYQAVNDAKPGSPQYKIAVDSAKIRKGSKVVNKDGKAFIVLSVDGDTVKLKNKEGKIFTRQNRTGLSLIENTEETSLLYDDSPLGVATANLYRSYHAVLEDLANVNDEQLFDEKVDLAFTQMLDFFQQKKTHKDMAQVINMLHNPVEFNKMRNRIMTVDAKVAAQKKEWYEEAFANNEKIVDYNELINQLYDLSLKLTPEGVDLIIDSKLPTDFYDAAAEKIIDESTDKIKFDKAIELIKDFFEKQKLKNTPPIVTPVVTPVVNTATNVVSVVVPPPIVVPPVVPQTNKKIEYDTPFEDMPEELQDSLIEGAKLANKAEGFQHLDENATKNEIIEDPWFLNDYMKYKHAKNLIDTYNEQSGQAVVVPPIVTVVNPTNTKPNSKQQALLDKFKDLNKRSKIVTITKKGYELLGKLFKRVSDFVGNGLVYKKNADVTNTINGSIVGNYVDILGRTVFQNEDITFVEFKSIAEADPKSGAQYVNLNTEETFNSLLPVLKTIKGELIKKHTVNGVIPVFVSDELLLSVILDKIKNFDGLAGTPDIVIVDGNGDYFIYDLKSKKQSGRPITVDTLNVPFDSKSKSDTKKWTDQQSVYARLFEEIIGQAPNTVNAIVIPVDYDREDFEGDYKEEELNKTFKPNPSELVSKGPAFIKALEIEVNNELESLLKKEVTTTVDTTTPTTDTKADIEVNKDKRTQIKLWRDEAKEEATNSGFIDIKAATPGYTVETDIFNKVIKVSGMIHTDTKIMGAIYADSLSDYYTKVDDFYDAELTKLVKADIERTRQKELNLLLPKSREHIRLLKESKKYGNTFGEIQNNLNVKSEKSWTSDERDIYYLNAELALNKTKEDWNIPIDDILNEEEIKLNKYLNSRSGNNKAAEINAKYDAEYIDKVKKGEFTAQQAKDALKEIGRLTPELSKQIDDAEIDALQEKPEEDFYQDYIANKEDLPKANLGPQIIYSTTTTGKTFITNSYSDVVDGEMIVYNWLVSKGDISKAKSETQFLKDVQNSGKVFYEKYGNNKEAIEEMIALFKTYKNNGYTVLTANWFMRKQSDKYYISKNKDAIVEEFVKRDEKITLAQAQSDAQKVLEDEAKDIRNFTEIKTNETLFNILFAKKETMNDIYTRWIIETESAVEEELNQLVDLIKTDESLSSLQISTLLNSINIKRGEYTKVEFDDVKTGDMLYLIDNELVTVEETKPEYITVKTNNEVKTINKAEFDAEVKSKHVMGYVEPTEKIILPENDEEYKKQTKDNDKGTDGLTDFINNPDTKKDPFNDIDPNDCS